MTRKTVTPLSCLILWAIVAINILAGAFGVIYDVHHIFHKSIPWIAAVIIGAFFAEAIIPITVIIWILVLVGILS